jgi:hypothetical protein
MSIILIRKDVLLKPLPKIVEFIANDNYWICGGCIRDCFIGEKYSDIDVFGNNLTELKKLSKLLIDSHSYKLAYDEDHMKTLVNNKTKIQIILRKEFKNIEELFSEFDFKMCQFAYNGTDIITTPEAVIDASRKRISVNNIQKEYSVDSLRRLQKYIQKGYTACNGTLKDIALSLSNLTPEEINSQLEFYADGKTPRIIRYD